MELQIAKLPKREKLLLHSCCGPCSTTSIMRLQKHFDLTVFYYNPNIDTAQEYEHRASEQRRLLENIKWVSLKTEVLEVPQSDSAISFIEAQYKPEEFLPMAIKFHDEKEGGARCTACYTLRLEKTAQKAQELHIPWFCTTLSLSPMKDSQRLNQIGEKLALKYGLLWLYSDFKKQNGYQESIKMSKEFDLYRQDYCGCTWSHQERLEQIAKQN